MLWLQTWIWLYWTWLDYRPALYLSTNVCFVYNNILWIVLIQRLSEPKIPEHITKAKQTFFWEIRYTVTDLQRNWIAAAVKSVQRNNVSISFLNLYPNKTLWLEKLEITNFKKKFIYFLKVWSDRGLLGELTGGNRRQASGT